MAEPAHGGRRRRGAKPQWDLQLIQVQRHDHRKSSRGSRESRELRLVAHRDQRSGASRTNFVVGVLRRLPPICTQLCQLYFVCPPLCPGALASVVHPHILDTWLRVPNPLSTTLQPCWVSLITRTTHSAASVSTFDLGVASFFRTVANTHKMLCKST